MLHIYIVSLKQDIEKREAISKILQDYELEFSFIDAIYGKELSEDTINSIRSKSVGSLIDRGFAPTHGEIGCTLSHLKVYQNILDNNLDWACILEDDVILDERFNIFIRNFQDTGLNPESLYLLGGQNGLSNKKIIKSIKNISTIGEQKFTKTIKSEDFIYRTCCYLISAPLAKKLIDLSRTNFILADDWRYLIKNDVIRQLYLSDFVHHPPDLSKSNLQQERALAFSNYSIEISTLSARIINSIKYRVRSRVRLLSLKAYRYIEKKD